MTSPILQAILANIFLAFASIVFTSFSHRVSVIWVNYFKASVATIAFLVFALLTGNFYLPTQTSSLLLMFSGIIGLCIGDMFLFKSFTTLGPGRTLILFSFHPLFTGVASYFLFGQGLNIQQFLAILTMVGCLYILGKENMDKNKSWAIGPLLIALLAIILDATGVIFTRLAFEQDPNIHTSMANLIRAASCTVVFTLWTSYRPIKLVSKFKAMSPKYKTAITVGTIFGTFISLLLHLNALKYGHLATISAIAATGPIWAAGFEFAFFKQKPSKYLYATFGLFALGMLLLNI